MTAPSVPNTLSMVAEGFDPSLSMTPQLDITAVSRALGTRSATVTDPDALPDLVTDRTTDRRPSMPPAHTVP